MSSQTERDVVIVSGPARAEYLHVLRAVGSSVAARAPLPYDAVDDLRLAVDEASAMLLAIRAPATTITLEVETLPDRLEIVVRSDVDVVGWPAPGMERTVGWTVLSALVDGVRTEAQPGGAALRLVKRIHGPAPTG